MKFRTRSDFSYEHPKPVVYPKTRPIFRESLDEFGRTVVKQDGETNFYAMIQEAAQDTLIYNLIDQYERSLDPTIFGSPSVGGFIDCMSMPRDLMEAENVRSQAKQLFAALPAEERKKYGNDFTTFLSDVNAKLAAKVVEAAQVTRQQVKDGVAPAVEGGSNGS